MINLFLTVIIMKHRNQQSGVILLHKRKGYTSFEEIRTLRNRYNLGKVGHAGTLDKFAEGLLIVLVGYMTKFSQCFMTSRKEYYAVMEFGKETETLDPEGDIICRKPVPELNSIEQVLPSFTGCIEQVPPRYSAVHVNGERAYKAANRGEAVKLRSRNVTVHEIDICSWEKPFLFCRIICSKGTYIRSLARDIGRAADSCAYVHSLKRTQSGQFSAEDACTVDTFNAADYLLQPEALLSRMNNVHVFIVKNQFRSYILNGRKPEAAWLEDSDAARYLNAMQQKAAEMYIPSEKSDYSCMKRISGGSEREQQGEMLFVFFSRQNNFLAAYAMDAERDDIRSIYVHSSGAEQYADNWI